MNGKLKAIASLGLKMTALICLFSMSSCCSQKESATIAERWSEDKANEWYQKQPWLIGCDYIPASAINQIEMWSKDTYDKPQIEKELAWAQELGFNTLRVFLSSVVWKNDAEGLKERMDDFLTICKSKGIKPFFVFFDDCWNAESSYGKQPEPKVGTHNSGWVQDPSASIRKDTVNNYPILKSYVQDILKKFANDERILLWDLYNEPGNSKHLGSSIYLLRNVFRWAREINPSQPITSGVWNTGEDYAALNAFALNSSDVISYHNYHDVNQHNTSIRYLKTLNRPLICTEYMARKHNSLFTTVLPMLKKEKVGAINWGFVSGKTNTIYAWDDVMPNGGEPKLWFHDIYRQDKTPFDQAEVDTIISLTKDNLKY